MLTEHALYERKWQNFPELAKLLDEKQLSANWTGLTSVSVNKFNQVERFLEIFALVQENKSNIEQAVVEIGDPVRRELTELSYTLTYISKDFAEASTLLSQIARLRE